MVEKYILWVVMEIMLGAVTGATAVTTLLLSRLNLTLPCASRDIPRQTYFCRAYLSCYIFVINKFISH